MISKSKIRIQRHRIKLTKKWFLFSKKYNTITYVHYTQAERREFFLVVWFFIYYYLFISYYFLVGNWFHLELRSLVSFSLRVGGGLILLPCCINKRNSARTTGKGNPKLEAASSNSR